VRGISCVILCIAACSALGAEVYRSIDENGIVVYSDRPEGDNTERVFVATRRGTPPPAPASRRSQTAPADEAAAPEVLNGEIPRGPSEAEMAAERAEKCTIARERSERYRISHRLFRNLPNGEREYLSDAEIDQARAKAEADVANWCG
jgi:hypothetical protein